MIAQKISALRRWKVHFCPRLYNVKAFTLTRNRYTIKYTSTNGESVATQILFYVRASRAAASRHLSVSEGSTVWPTPRLQSESYQT